MNRTMTPRLAAAIAALTYSQKQVLLTHEPDGSWVDGLLEGVKSQVLHDEAQTGTVLQRLEDDHREYVDSVDLAVNGVPPAVTGKPATFDPETGDWRFSD